MSFLRPSVFDLHSDDSNPRLQYLNKKRVNHEAHKRFWDNLPPNFPKNFIS